MADRHAVREVEPLADDHLAGRQSPVAVERVSRDRARPVVANEHLVLVGTA
jgi:hypothetical protein